MKQAASPDTHIVLFRKPGKSGMTAVCRRIGLKTPARYTDKAPEHGAICQ